jgi:hypothetical protein
MIRAADAVSIGGGFSESRRVAFDRRKFYILGVVLVQLIWA